MHTGVNLHSAYIGANVRLTHIGGLSDKPLLSVKDMSDASDQLQGTAVIRALEENEHMCSVKAC